MKNIFTSFIIGLFSLNIAFTCQATTDKIALIIGNSAYQHTAPLPNPENDATVLAEKLKALDFDVIHINNAGVDQTKNVISHFNDKITDKKLGLFFYAGHGVSINGINYLIPVDAKLDSTSAIKKELIETESILSASKEGQKTILVFLDACRNNPFKENLAKIEGINVSRGLVISRKIKGDTDKGLSKFESSNRNLFISFATQPGNVAVDGLENEKHSPFSKAIIDNIDQKLEVRELMTKVRSSVAERTKFHQIPWEQNSLLEQVFLAGKPDLFKKIKIHIGDVTKINTSWKFVTAALKTNRKVLPGDVYQIDTGERKIEAKVGKVNKGSISLIPTIWQQNIPVGSQVIYEDFE